MKKEHGVEDEMKIFRKGSMIGCAEINEVEGFIMLVLCRGRPIIRK